MAPPFELTELTFTIKLPLEPDDAFKKLLSQLGNVSGQLKIVRSALMRLKTEKTDPYLILSDQTSTFFIFLTKNDLEIHISKESEKTDDDKKPSPSNVFDKNHLTQLSSEVNYILGLLTGTLQPSAKLTMEGEIVFEASKFKFNFNHLLSKEIILNQQYRSNLTGVQIEHLEEFWDLKVKCFYELLQNDDTAEGTIVFKSDIPTPLNFNTIIDTLTKSYNNVLEKLSVTA